MVKDNSEEHKFTFRYNAKDNNLLEKAKKQFRTKAKTKAIKASLYYLYNELPEILKQYKEMEKKYSLIEREHDEMKNHVRTFYASYTALQKFINQ